MFCNALNIYSGYLGLDVSFTPPCQEMGLLRLEMTGLLRGRWNFLSSGSKRESSSLLWMSVSVNTMLPFLHSSLKPSLLWLSLSDLESRKDLKLRQLTFVCWW